MNNALYFYPYKTLHALPKDTYSSFSDPCILCWHSARQCRQRSDTFVNSPQQVVMILMSGSHHGGHVSQQEMSQVKHVLSVLINSLATCCHLTLLDTATHLPPFAFFLLLFLAFVLSCTLSQTQVLIHPHRVSQGEFYTTTKQCFIHTCFSDFTGFSMENLRSYED